MTPLTTPTEARDDDLIRRGDILPAIMAAGFGGSALVAAIGALSAAQPTPAPAPTEAQKWQWRDMASAPKDGKHIILAIQTASGFVYSVEGAFMYGKWMNAFDLNVDPLCWFPKTLIPDEFLPWTDEFKAHIIPEELPQ